MKAIFTIVLLATLAVVLVLPLAEDSVFAQAPTGRQGGAPPPAQQQQNPDSPKATNPAQQAPQAGVTIAVDVPMVTLDVVATTQHGDIIPGLKKENFRILDEGVPQTDRKSTRLNSSHSQISYAVFCLKKKKKTSKRQYH